MRAFAAMHICRYIINGENFASGGRRSLSIHDALRGAQTLALAGSAHRIASHRMVVATSLFANYPHIRVARVCVSVCVCARARA